MSKFSGSLPLQASEVAARWDSLYDFLVWISIFFFMLVVGGMILYAVKYRHSAGGRTKYITGNHLLEGIWIVIPTILLMVIFGWGWSVYHQMTQVPADAYEVRVIGKQWLWQFQYDNGKTTIGELYVPVNRPVRLLMTSTDVIHSFFIPNFRVKQDVVPGMYTSVWFEANVPGKHDVYCAEYCGTAHSGMLAKVYALTEQQWNDWLEGKKLEGIPEVVSQTAPAPGGKALERVSLADQGKSISQSRGCIACHSADGTRLVGPSFKGIFGKEEEMDDGAKVKVDENYIRESIENPQAKIVKGFPKPSSMPTFKGILSEEEMSALIAYIKSLK
jgi:cytochrome c oxidase subunit 2